MSEILFMRRHASEAPTARLMPNEAAVRLRQALGLAKSNKDKVFAAKLYLWNRCLGPWKRA